MPLSSARTLTMLYCPHARLAPLPPVQALVLPTAAAPRSLAHVLHGTLKAVQLEAGVQRGPQRAQRPPLSLARCIKVLKVVLETIRPPWRFPVRLH